MSGFRDHLFAPDDERVASLRGLDARQYAEVAKKDDFTGGLIEGWKQMHPVPFRGITSDGVAREDLFDLEPVDAADAAPTARMVAAADALLDILDAGQADRFGYDLESPQWRSWANPEFMQHDTGLRLDEIHADVRDGILALIEASLSTRGYRLVRDCMRINGFLGDVVELPLLMNEFSYNAALYGTPSATEPWGWQLFGHHVALNCLVAGTRMVISPVFFGAEPDVIDEGEFAGTRVLNGRIDLARRLMGALSAAQRNDAIVYEQMVDPRMPEGRVHAGDERHLGGAFQDNRVIPYEGVRVSDFGADARARWEALVRDFLAYLPDGPARVRFDEVVGQVEDTWFSWIGGWEGDEPFYFRIQSPVAMFELDHHCGVFLDNREPAAFHIHTLVRTPNGNDYGRLIAGSVLGRPLTP